MKLIVGSLKCPLPGMEALCYLNFYVVFNHKQAVGFCERRFLSAGLWLGNSWELWNSTAEFPQPQLYGMAGGWRDRWEDVHCSYFFLTQHLLRRSFLWVLVWPPPITLINSCRLVSILDCLASRTSALFLCISQRVVVIRKSGVWTVRLLPDFLSKYSKL